jgi:hypothetical protein
MKAAEQEERDKSRTRVDFDDSILKLRAHRLPNSTPLGYQVYAQGIAM